MTAPSPTLARGPARAVRSQAGGVGAAIGLLLAAVLPCAAGCRDLAAPPDTLRLVVGTPPEALDPRFATSAVAMRLSHLVFAPLLVIGDDLAARPYLAESLTRTDDVTWEVVLRPGAVFHDGSPVTAEDVAFTYQALGDDDVRSPHAPKFKRVRRIDVVDARTVRFVLEEPFAAFPLELCALGVVPASCRGRTEACREHPVGAGAFAVEVFDSAAETLVLRRHDAFVLGRPPLPRLSVRVVRDSTTRLLELIDGKADLVVGDISPTQLDVVRAEEDLVVQSRPGLAYTYLAMNLRPPPEGGDPASEEHRTRSALSNPQVRRALAHALDVDRVIHTKLRGAARRATGLLPPGHWAKAEGLTVPAYDPARARALLDEAGFPDRGADAGGRFRVVLSTTTDRLRRSLAIVWAHQLREVGLDVTVRVGEWATLYEDIKRGNFELFSAIWVPVVEPDLLHWVFHSENIPGPGKAGGNRGAYVSADVDGWLQAGRTELDPEKRAPFYHLVEQRLLEDMPYVPLWFDDAVAVHHRRVQGLELTRSQDFLGLAGVSLSDATAAGATATDAPLSPGGVASGEATGAP